MTIRFKLARATANGNLYRCLVCRDTTKDRAAHILKHITQRG